MQPFQEPKVVGTSCPPQATPWFAASEIVHFTLLNCTFNSIFLVFAYTRLSFFFQPYF